MTSTTKEQTAKKRMSDAIATIRKHLKERGWEDQENNEHYYLSFASLSMVSGFNRSIVVHVDEFGSVTEYKVMYHDIPTDRDNTDFPYPTLYQRHICDGSRRDL